tara:strand:- start:92 stop:835 length:744 start_codon:yes stop_codon:yes gene_type:complete
MTKNAFQIFINDKKEGLPSILNEACNTFREAFSDHDYTLYNKDMIIEIINQEFGKEVISAFHKLKPYAYKSDLARYCISYLYGGWYADVSVKLSTKLLTINYNFEFLGFIDRGDGHGIPNRLHYPIQNSFYYVKEKNQIMAKAIDLVLENCSNESYGITSVCPSGPGVLGRAFTFSGQKENHVLGYFMPLTPNHKKLNTSYVLPDGTILAQHKDAWFPSAKGGSFSAFGAKGTNNYQEMYLDKNIYN